MYSIVFTAFMLDVTLFDIILYVFNENVKIFYITIKLNAVLNAGFQTHHKEKQKN